MTTYGSILHSYADTLDHGTSDTDLSEAQRAAIARLLRAVVQPSVPALDYIAPSVAYPPSDRSRDDVARELGYVVRRTTWSPLDAGMSMADWDAAVARAYEVIRNV